MTQNPTIKIPPERLDQLKAIGLKLNLSIADTIGHLIRAEIERGTIADVVPGFVVKRRAHGVSVTFGDHAPKLYPLPAAEAFGITIQDVLEELSDGIIDIDRDYLVARIGNGIKVGTPSLNASSIVSRDVARDIARLIRSAAR